MSYSRSIYAPYIGETPPTPIGSEMPNILSISNEKSKGGKVKRTTKNLSGGAKKMNSWALFLQQHGGKGLSMNELRANYHSMHGGRRSMHGSKGGSQLAVGEMSSYSGPRGLH